MNSTINLQNIGFLCGFEMEAVVARKISQHVAMSGAREALAFERAEALIKNGAQGLISFGVAGALTDSVAHDAVIIPSAIISNHGRTWVCDAALTQHLKKGAPSALHGPVYGSTVLIPSPAEKRKINAATGCVIVDMESQVVAEVASRHSLPFAVLRGVSDGVDDVFPEAAFKGLNADGSTNIPAVLLSLARNPFQLPALKKLFTHTNAALQKLDACLKKSAE